MNWRGPVSMVVSAIVVILAMTLNTVAVGGVIFHPYFGVMLALSAWFAYWGAIGAVVGYAVPVLVGIPFLPALESIALTFVAVAVFVGQVRARWIDIDARRRASLIGLIQVIIIAALIRQFFVFALFTMPALFRYPAVGPVLWGFLISLVELGVTTLIVVLLLLRMATPMIKQLLGHVGARPHP